MPNEQNVSGAQVPCVSLFDEIERIIAEHPSSGDHAEDGRYCLFERMSALYALAEKYDLILKANVTPDRTATR
jgi:hypothetical protein